METERGTEDDGVSLRAFLAGKDVVQDGGVDFRSAAGEVVFRADRQTVLGRRQRVRVEMSVDGFTDDGAAAAGDLVEAVLGVDDHAAFGAETGQNAGQRLDEAFVGDTDEVFRGAGVVDDGPEHVERGVPGKLAADGCQEPVHDVAVLREQEAEVGLLQDFLDALRRDGQLHAEGFQDVCRTAVAGGGTVAVLRDFDAGGSADDGGSRRDIERVGLVPSGTDDLQDVLIVEELVTVVAHALGRAGELLDGGALQSEGDQERADLDVRGTPGHDLVDGGFRLVEGQVLFIHEGDDGILDHSKCTSGSSPQRGAFKKSSLRL